MWVGLAVVYIKATWLAVVSGPNRKPAYRVTRKVHNFAWYWRETIVQIVLFVMLMGGILYALLSARTLEEFDLGTAYWAAFLGFILGGFVRKGWFGLNWFEQLKLLVTRRLIHPLYQLSATTLKTWEELFTPAQLPQLHLETEVLSWEPEVSSFLVAPIEVPAPAPAPTLLQQAGD
jgi:hypothetical protein